MHQLVSEIIAGKKCDVEAVEALLLLAEWEPQDSLSEGKEVGCGEEDRAAWMHVVLALRIGYFLGLDRTAIKHDNEDKAAHFNRRRVTWAGQNLPTPVSRFKTNSPQRVTYLTDSFLLVSGGLSGQEARLCWPVLADMVVKPSTTSLLFNPKLQMKRIMPVFYRRIWISLSYSATYMMSFTLEWVVV